MPINLRPKSVNREDCRIVLPAGIRACARPLKSCLGTLRASKYIFTIDTKHTNPNPQSQRNVKD